MNPQVKVLQQETEKSEKSLTQLINSLLNPNEVKIQIKLKKQERRSTCRIFKKER
jgi:hypothetical protein